MDYLKHSTEIVLNGEFVMSMNLPGCDITVWKWKGKYICFDNSDKSIKEADVYEMSVREICHIATMFSSHRIKFGGF